MGSLNRREMFGPLDLEIIDRVYDVASAYIEARDLYRDALDDAGTERLRQLVFACVGNDRLDFDVLCDRVLAQLAEIATDRRAA